MKIRLYNNRYLQFFPEEGEHVVLEESIESLEAAVSLDLQDVIGIEGARGPKGLSGDRGMSAKDILIGIGALAPNATDTQFYECIKGEPGTGTGIANIAVVSTQNTHVDRVNCNQDGICQILEGSASGRNATKTIVRVTLTDNTVKEFGIISEGAEAPEGIVAMNSEDYAAYFGSTTIPTGSRTTTRTRNGTTIYLVPVSELDFTLESEN